MAGEPGFEPRLDGSEPYVLPLHYSPIFLLSQDTVCPVLQPASQAGGYSTVSFALLTRSELAIRLRTRSPFYNAWVLNRDITYIPGFVVGLIGLEPTTSTMST